MPLSLRVSQGRCMSYQVQGREGLPLWSNCRGSPGDSSVFSRGSGDPENGLEWPGGYLGIVETRLQAVL